MCPFPITLVCLSKTDRNMVSFRGHIPWCNIRTCSILSLSSTDDNNPLAWFALEVVLGGEDCKDTLDAPLLVLEKKSVICLHPVENRFLRNYHVLVYRSLKSTEKLSHQSRINHFSRESAGAVYCFLCHSLPSAP